jgi:hypothetical protein
LTTQYHGWNNVFTFFFFFIIEAFSSLVNNYFFQFFSYTLCCLGLEANNLFKLACYGFSWSWKSIPMLTRYSIWQNIFQFYWLKIIETFRIKFDTKTKKHPFFLKKNYYSWSVLFKMLVHKFFTFSFLIPLLFGF